MRNCICIIFTIALHSLDIYAQMDIKSVGICKKNNFKTLPIGYYTPETRLAAGGLLYYMFCLHKEDTLAKRSNIQTYASYTQNKQYAIETQWDIFGKANSFYSNGELDYIYFPEFYFGVGNQSRFEDRQLLSYKKVRLTSKNLWKVGESYYLGGLFQGQYMFSFEAADMSFTPKEKENGLGGYMTAGIGPIFISDTRDNVLNASKGHFVEISASAYNYGVYDRFRFLNISYDGRKYISLSHGSCLALHTYFVGNLGDVPFRMMPAIGGPRYLRGYYYGRFRDNNMYAFQTEWRQKVWKRFGMVLFTGFAQVGSNIKNLLDTSPTWNVGGGLRFVVNRAENVNIRLDVGYTESQNMGFYLVFAEAF